MPPGRSAGVAGPLTIAWRCSTHRRSTRPSWASDSRSIRSSASYLLAEAIDVAGADLVLHGHAHGGTERGSTPGGVPVRNVAQPVIGAAYKVYTLGP